MDAGFEHKMGETFKPLAAAQTAESSAREL